MIKLNVGTGRSSENPHESAARADHKAEGKRQGYRYIGHVHLHCHGAMSLRYTMQRRIEGGELIGALLLETAIRAIPERRQRGWRQAVDLHPRGAPVPLPPGLSRVIVAMVARLPRNPTP